MTIGIVLRKNSCIVKTLVESILSSTKAGKEGLKEKTRNKIQQWLIEHELYDTLIINDDNTVSLKPNKRVLELEFNDYDELPEYIQLVNFEKCAIVTQNADRVIKSFRGFPDKCERILLYCANTVLPPIKIEVVDDFSVVDEYLEKFESLDVTYNKKHFGEIKKFYVNSQSKKFNMSSDNVKVEGANFVTLPNLPFIKRFANEMSKSGKINKENNYTDVCNPDTHEKIQNFLDKLGIDPKIVNVINYSATCKMVKNSNKNWYRCKRIL